MKPPNLDQEEIAQRGKEIYQRQLRADIETAENIGKIIAIDLNTCAYEIDKDILVACHRLQAKQPNAVTWASNSKFKKLRGIVCQSVYRTIKHKINQRLPVVKKEIFSQTENILKKTSTSTTLVANLLVSNIC
jgi:hypothetical protein